MVMPQLTRASRRSRQAAAPTRRTHNDEIAALDEWHREASDVGPYGDDRLRAEHIPAPPTRKDTGASAVSSSTAVG
jgi:hypothetical protein